MATPLQHTLRGVITALRANNPEDLEQHWLQVPEELRTDLAYVQRIAASTRRLGSLAWARDREMHAKAFEERMRKRGFKDSSHSFGVAEQGRV